MQFREMQIEDVIAAIAGNKFVVHHKYSTNVGTKFWMYHEDCDQGWTISIDPLDFPDMDISVKDILLAMYVHTCPAKKEGTEE